MKANGAPGLLIAAVSQIETWDGLGILSPEFVEFVMGWPMGWTAIEPLGTDKFRQWRHSHGRRFDAA